MYDPLASFHLVSLEILQLIAHKKATNATREAEILQNFYNHTLKITTDSSEDLHIRKLETITAHYKGKLLEIELKQVYNDVFKQNPSLAADLIVNSVIPTKKDLQSQVILK